MSAEFRLYDALHGAPLRTKNGLHAELVGLRLMAVSGVYAPLDVRLYFPDGGSVEYSYTINGVPLALGQEFSLEIADKDWSLLSYSGLLSHEFMSIPVLFRAIHAGYSVEGTVSLMDMVQWAERFFGLYLVPTPVRDGDRVGWSVQLLFKSKTSDRDWGPLSTPPLGGGMFPSMTGALLYGLSTAFDLLFTHDCSALSSFVVGEVYRTRDGREVRILSMASDDQSLLLADVETFVGSGKFVHARYTGQGIPVSESGSTEEDDLDSHLTSLL
jgi:hypothetical protein